MPKRIVIAGNGHGTRIGIGPVYSDEAAARLRADAESRGWTGEAVIPLLSKAEFTTGQPAPSAPPPAHTCHAKGCRSEIRPALFMCARHWAMVPPALRTAIWATYRPGQERDKRPSPEYLAAARDAINAVAEQEQKAGR